MSRPNIVFILADQLRADFLGCYGADFVKTPNIDRIAAEGIQYSKAYSTTPLCVPARAKLLTGAGPTTTGITTNGQWLPPDYRERGLTTWPLLLSESGYRTAAVGKMHFYPWDERHGFGHRVIAEDKRWINVRDDYWYFLQENGHRKYHGNEHEGYHENKGAIINRIPWELSVDHFVGSESCRYIDAYNDPEPFAMMVGFPGPHCPYDPNQEFLDRIDTEKLPQPVESPGILPEIKRLELEGQKRPWNGVDYSEFSRSSKMKIKAHYAALVEQIDLEVGRIIASLEKKGILDSTWIIFSTDHGDFIGDHNMVGKNSFFEAAIHVPILVRAPKVEPKVTDELVDLGDITSTILQAADVPVQDYMDCKPLPGLGGSSGRNELFGILAKGWMIYDGRYKLCRYTTGETVFFDLQEDPLEQVDRSDDPSLAEKIRSMDTRLVQEMIKGFSSSHADKIAHAASDNLEFGFEGWERPKGMFTA